MQRAVFVRGQVFRIFLGGGTCCVLAVALVLVLASCNPFRRAQKPAEEVSLIAVMPIEPVEPVNVAPPEQLEPMLPDEGLPLAMRRSPQVKSEQIEPLPPDAGREVTAAVYQVLSSSSQWRLVPDLSVSQALRRLKSGGDLPARAVAIGKEVAADAVLCGTVSRYRERVGSEMGVRLPAAVAFTLKLVSAKSGKILWAGSFDQTQQAFATNFANWWQFWRGGPQWFTAREFTRLGVERLLKDMSQRVS